jgi:hypothetical protein
MPYASAGLENLLPRFHADDDSSVSLRLISPLFHSFAEGEFQGQADNVKE